MWTFEIRAERLLLDGLFRGTAYAGYDDGDGVPEPGEGKSDPSQQKVRNVGPLPVGKYKIGKPFFHPTAGPCTLRLTPLPGTETYGRSGFLIHGDSARNPGSASHGCIVASRPLRIEIGESIDDGQDVIDVVA